MPVLRRASPKLRPTVNSVRLTRQVRDTQVTVTCGGAPTFVWPGGGITLMVDVTRLPDDAFGHVPTPALVAPIEFTMRRDDFEALGGYTQHIVPLAEAAMKARVQPWRPDNPWPVR